jgi:hypothetical protein
MIRHRAAEITEITEIAVPRCGGMESRNLIVNEGARRALARKWERKSP